MYSPEAEPFEDIQVGSPPISPSSKRDDYGFPKSGTAWKRRSSVSSTEHQPRPVFEPIAVPPGITQLGPPTTGPTMSTSPTTPTAVPTSPSRSSRLSGASRRLSRASAKSLDPTTPSSPPRPHSSVLLGSPPVSTQPIQPPAPSSPEATSAGVGPSGSRLLAPRTPPHAALASPPLSGTLSSSRRTSASSVDKMTPPSSSSSLSSIPGLGPAQFGGGLAPDLSNPYRSQMERPLDTVKRLSRQVERRDYSRAAPAAGPSSYRQEDSFASSESKSNHSPTPSSHSAPPFVMSGAYPTPTNRLPSALAMSGPYPTRGSNLSSFDSPWPTWEGPSSSTIDAKLASKKARRMSSAPNQQLNGERRKSDHGSVASRKSNGKEREHLSPNGSPTLGTGTTYAPSPLSQASTPVTTPATTPPAPPSAPPVLQRSGSSKMKKRLSMWGRGKSHEDANARDEDDSRSRTVSAPTDTVSQGFSPPPPLPPMPATISHGRRSKPPVLDSPPPQLTISTSELGVQSVNPSPASSTRTSTPSSSGGLFSKFGSSRGKPKELAKAAPAPAASASKPAGPATLAVPADESKPKKGGRGSDLRAEAKEERGLGGLWKRLSVSKKGSKSPVSPVKSTTTDTKGNTTSTGNTSIPNGKPSSAAGVVAVSTAKPTPTAAKPAPPAAAPPVSRGNLPAQALVVAAPISNGSSSSTTPTRGEARRSTERRVESPPLSDRTVRSSSQTRSPPRPVRDIPAAPVGLYGAKEVGTDLPGPRSPATGIRGLPSPPRIQTSPIKAVPVVPSPSMPSFRQLPSAPQPSQYHASNGQGAPGPMRRGNSYEPPSPSAAVNGDYADILARCASHPSRPPTPPPKQLNGHALEPHHSGASDSQSGSEISRGLWEPQTAGSSFTAYSYSTSGGQESGIDSVKV